MTEPRHHALAEHVRDCDECRADARPIDELAARLDAAVIDVDAQWLSRLARVRLAPELQARARAMFWRRVSRTLGLALVPLPLVLAVDLWLLLRIYEFAAAWVPSAFAAYLVISYAASLLVLIGAAYAAIPLLLAPAAPEAEAEPAPA